MNKHKVIAIMMAPFLALGGYILADIYMGNDFDKADKRLVVTNECKPVSGQCEILGVGMAMRLSFKNTPQNMDDISVEIHSKTSLDDIAMSLIVGEEESQPVKMQASNDKKHWMANIKPSTSVGKNNLKVRLAVSYKAVLHFSEFPVSY